MTRISKAQLDAEIRGLLVRGGQPADCKIQFWTADAERAATARDFAWVDLGADPPLFGFSRKILDLETDHRRAVLGHEAGHVLAWQYWGDDSEPGADLAAQQFLGIPICYDPAYPGKGLQVDCRHSAAANPRGTMSTAKNRRPNAFMQPEYVHGTWYLVEMSNFESTLVPGDLVQKKPTLKDFALYVDGKPKSFEKVTGWFARLSASGYMDATDWAGPFKSEAEARKYIEVNYDVDPDTGDELDESSENPTKGSVKGNKPIALTIDDVAEVVGVESPWKAFEDADYGDAYASAHRYALEGGATEEEAEEQALKAEQEQGEEEWNQYAGALTSTFETLLSEHHLGATEKADKKRGMLYVIEPTVSWNDAADQIRETINGVGYFHFNSLKEFLDSGPWTAKEAVRDHLGWISRWPEVYGSGTSKSMFQRSLRSRNPRRRNPKHPTSARKLRNPELSRAPCWLNPLARKLRSWRA